MRELLEIKVTKQSERWIVLLTWTRNSQKYVVRTGPTYESKEEAVEEANEWLARKDDFAEVFQYKVKEINVD